MNSKNDNWLNRLSKKSMKNLAFLEKEDNENDENSVTKMGIKKKTTKLLKTFMGKGLFDIQKKKFISSDQKHELLIEEIKKPKIKEIVFKEKKKPAEKDPNSRKIDIIQTTLKSLPGFVKIMKYYNIDDDAIRTAAGLITYRKYNAGTYVFRQDDKSDFLYGIISGKVAIRERKKIITKKEINHIRKNSLDSTGSIFNPYLYKEKLTKDFIEYIEEDKLILKEGQCFGEWGLIYRIERSSSAFCVEDTDLFLIDPHGFDQSFSKCMVKAELDRKMFLMKIIPFFSTLPKLKFDILYKSFIAKFLSKNEYIYHEGSMANSLYVIYQGGCILEKNILKPNSKNQKKQVKILYLECGNIAGLESLDLVAEVSKDNDKVKSTVQSDNHFPKYNSSLISDEENTIVIQIKIDTLSDLKIPFCNAMEQMRIIKDNTINDFINKKMEIKAKMKLLYKGEIMKRSLTLNDFNATDNKALATKVDQYIKNTRMTSLPKNNLKNYTTDMSLNYSNKNKSKTITEDHSSHKNKQKPLEWPFKTIFKNSYYQTIDTFSSLGTENDKNPINENTKNDNKLMPIKLAITQISKLPPTKNVSNFTFYFQQIKNSLKTTNETVEEEIKRDSTISNKAPDTEASTHRINVEKSKLESNPIITETTLNKVEENDDKSAIKKPCITKNSFKKIYLNTIDKGKDLNNFHETEGKRIILTNKRKETLIIPKDVKSNLVNWNSSLKSKIFDSGAYELPLVCLTHR